MTNSYIQISSPVGELILAAHDKALTHLIWTHSSEAQRIQKSHHNMETALLKKAAQQLREYFAGQRKTFELPLDFSGTEFQSKVWKTLMQIPYGEVWTYKAQAIKMGSPKAVRAVGRTNGKNPISIIIPCHRVVGSSGKLTGYAGGMDRKRQLLELEGLTMTSDQCMAPSTRLI